MASINEQILRTTKEIIVKFIECGRISPAGFHETFRSVYTTVEETIKGSGKTEEQEDKKEK
ncbi:MAG: conjugal transfer protein TraB [Desulfobacterales bacterium]|nr:conjugal transfer protein TraB [Desulfobacterales bacterium]